MQRQSTAHDEPKDTADPRGAVEAITDPATRRSFLKLMGASLALAGVTACTTQPEEAIVPYVRQPEELIPGKPMYYATAMSLGALSPEEDSQCDPAGDDEPARDANDRP